MTFKPQVFWLFWTALTLTFAPLHFGQAIEFGSQLRIDCPDAPLSRDEQRLLREKEKALSQKRALEREILVLDRKEQVFLAHIRRVLETSAAEQVIEHLQNPSRRMMDYDMTPTGCGVGGGPSTSSGNVVSSASGGGLRTVGAQDLGFSSGSRSQPTFSHRGSIPVDPIFCLDVDPGLLGQFPTGGCVGVRYGQAKEPECGPKQKAAGECPTAEQATNLICNTWSLFVRDQDAVSPEICQARVFHQADSVTSSQIKNCQRALAEAQTINKEVASKRADLQALNSLLDQLLDDAELARIQTEADCADGRCPNGARSRRSGSSLGSVIRASEFCSGR